MYPCPNTNGRNILIMKRILHILHAVHIIGIYFTLGILANNLCYHEFSCMVGTEGTSVTFPGNRLSYWP